MRTVLFDENMIGVARLCQARSVFPNVLYPGHPDIPEVVPSTRDVDIFDVIGVNGRDLIFITRDKRIRTRPSEAEKLADAGVRAFVVAVRESLTKDELCQLVQKHSNTIVELDSTTTPPFIYTIHKHKVTKYR